MFRIIFLVLALITSSLAAWLILRGGGASEIPRANYEGVSRTLEVLVANTNIPYASEVTASQLKWSPFPLASIKPFHITRDKNTKALEMIAGMYAKTNIYAGDPIIEDKLSPKGNWGLSSILPSGFRAVAVRISADNTAGGFIRPGHRVDVMSTVVTARGQDRVAETRILLRNVLVLAVDQVMELDKQSGNNKNAASVGKTATLQVTPEEAEALISAEVKGRLSLALRASEDTNEPKNKDVIKNTPTQSVTIIRGDKIELQSAPNQ